MYFLAHVFQNISLKRDSKLEHTTTLSTKSKCLTIDLLTRLEQTAQSLSHCRKSAIVTLDMYIMRMLLCTNYFLW